MIRIGTLFSGGLAAVEWAVKYEELEHEIVFACEWDKYARAQYLAFHGEPTSAFYEDVTHMDGKPYLNTIDLMVWGSPCQDLSLAGKRKGFDGEKSSLFREGARIMGEVMPKAFIFENVKGLLSSNSGADYKEVEKTFRELGYHMAMKVVNAKQQGTAQNRERVFVIGFLDDDEYHDFHFSENVPLTKCLRDYLEDEIEDKYYLSDKMVKSFIHKSETTSFKFNPSLEGEGYSPCLTARYYKMGVSDPYIKEVHVKSATSKGYETATQSDSINFTHPGSTTRRGRVGVGVAQTLDCACNQAVIDFQIGAIRGRNPDNPTSRIAGLPTKQMLEINKNGVSNCLTSVQKDNVVIEQKEAFRIRRLTPRECFRLMGMNDEDIKLVNSDTQSYKIAGNGIEINTMRSIIRQLYRPVKSSLSLF